MTGQGVIGRDCAWCGLPATTEVEVQPVRYRTVSRRDPVTGKRTAQQVFERAAILAAVCDEHRQITVGQAPAISVPRERTTTSVEQLGIFAVTADERSRDTIGGETGR